MCELDDVLKDCCGHGLLANMSQGHVQLEGHLVVCRVTLAQMFMSNDFQQLDMYREWYWTHLREFISTLRRPRERRLVFRGLLCW